MDNKIKHLEFIQSTITRMNQNSFQIKGWMITIVSALLALYARSEKKLYIFIAIVPAIVFWFLDELMSENLKCQYRNIKAENTAISGSCFLKLFFHYMESL